MSNVDERVVKMTFDNKQFESGVQNSIKSLQNLDKSTSNMATSASKSLNSFEQAGNNISLSGLEKSIGFIERRFSTLGIAGMTVIQNITNSAINAGKNLGRALTDPIIEGGKRRAKNIEQAKFQIEGLGKKWADVEEDINYGVKDTAYGLDVAAKAASQFMASGVKEGKEMKTALRGISGVAAMTNSSYEDISRIFTQVAGANRVYQQDLMQLSSRGMNANATLGKYLHKTETEVRQMVKDGKIDFNIFAAAMDSAFGEHAKEANKTFDGALANMKASLSRIGAEIAGPTYTDLRDVFNSLTPIFNNVKKALLPFLTYANKQLKNLTKAATKFLGKFGVDLDSLGKKVPKNLRKSVEATKAFMKSIENIGKGIKNIYETAKNLLIPIKEAFREIFPKKTIKDVKKFTNGFKNATKLIKEDLAPFTQILNEKVLSDKMQKIKRIFKGFFALFSIAKTIILKVKDVIVSLWFNTKKFRGGLIDVIAKIADFIVKLDKALKSGNKFKDFFTKIKDSLGGASESIKGFFTKIKDSIFGSDKDIEKIKNKTTILESIGNALKKVFDFLGNLVVAIIPPVINGIKGAFNSLKNIFSSFGKSNGTFDKIISGGLVAVLIKFLQSLKIFTQSSTIFGSIKRLLNNISSAIFQFKKKMQVGMLKDVAKSVALLVVSMMMLSSLNEKKLSRGIAGLASVLTELSIFIRTFNPGKLKGFLRIKAIDEFLRNIGLTIVLLSFSMKKLAVLSWEQIGRSLSSIAALLGMITGIIKILSSKKTKVIVKGSSALIMMAFSIKILSKSMVQLSKLSWDEIGRGLSAIGGLIAFLTAFAKINNKTKGLVKVGLGLALVSYALKIIAGVAKDFSKMSWESLGKAGAAIGGLLVVLTAFAKINNKTKGLVKVGLGLVLVSYALKIIAGVAKDFSKMPWESLGKAGAAIGGLLVVLTAFAKINNKTKGLVKVGLGLVLVSYALKIIAGVAKDFSKMSWESLGKAGAAIGGLLVVLTAFAKINKGSGIITTAIGLTIFATALILLGKVIKSLGGLKIDQLGMALLSLIGVFTVLGLATAILKPLIPAMYALSGAVLIFGVAVAALGAGVLALSAGLAALAGSRYVIEKAILNITTGVANAIPVLLNSFDDAIKLICNIIINNAPAIFKAFKIVILQTLKMVKELIPKIVDVAAALIIEVLDVLIKKLPVILAKIGTLVSVLIGEIINALGKIDAQTFASAILAFGALAGIFVILSKIRASVKDALIVGLAMVAVFGTLTLVFLALNTIDPDSLMKITLSLVTLLAAISGAMLLFGLLGGLASAADAALIPIAIFIGGIGAILLALGAINKIPFVKDLIDSGGELLASIGSAIGKLIGGLVGGIASGIASNLPKIATSLSKFMKNLQPFLKGLKSISRGMMDSAFMIVKLLLAFTAMSVVNSITNFFTGGNGDVCKLIIQFGESLAKLGPNISKFAASVKGISAKDVSTATFAALMLAKVANGLPKSGGFLQSILGETMSLETFGKNLVVFGNGMADFSNSVKDIKIGHVTAAASAAKMLSEIAKNLPKEGGFLEGIVGKTQSLSTFAKQLPGIGEGIKAYYDSIKNNFKDKKTGKLNKNTLEILNSSIDIAKKFAEFAVKISEIKIDEGSFKAFWEGSSTSLENFGNQIASFGKGLVKFAKYVTTGFDYKDESLYGDTVKHMAGIFSGGDKDRLNEVENGIEMAKKFVNLAKQINTIIDPSDFQKMFGDDTKTTLKNFGQQLPFLAKGMVEFSQIINGNLNKIYYGGTYTDIARSSKNGIAGLDSEAIERALAPLTALLKPVLELTKTTDSNEIEKAGDLISKLKDLDFSALSLVFDPTKINYENIKNAGDCLSALLNPLGDLAVYASAEQIEKLGNLLSTISGFNLENLVKAFTDNASISKLNKAGNTIGTKITASICKILGINENDNVKTANSKKALNIGKIIIRSICDGMAMVSFDETVQKIINRLNATFDNEKYKLQLHIIGYNISKGLAKGMTDKKGIKPVKSSAKQLGEIAKKFTMKSLEQKSPSKAYWRMGLNNDKGLAFGMLDNLKLISDASKKAGDTAVDSISMPMETISNLLSEDLDSNPVITPVLDLSNIQNGSGLIDNLLTPNALSFGMGVNASLNSSYDKPAKNTPKVYNDSKVVGAIGELQSDIGTLNNNISNLKVVMNTGEMVGVLSPRIDKSLGVAATYKERGI